MHRFFIKPESLGYKPTVFNHWDDPRWRALVREFRECIRYREWKDIDRRFRLLVKVENWEGKDVLLIANDKRDSDLVDAYLKSGFLEGQAIIVFADASIPWERLKPFKAVNPLRRDRHKGGATGLKGEAAIGSLPARATEERHTRPTSLVNGTGRSGEPVTFAGGYRTLPKVGSVDLLGESNQLADVLG